MQQNKKIKNVPNYQIDTQNPFEDSCMPNIDSKRFEEYLFPAVNKINKNSFQQEIDLNIEENNSASNFIKSQSLNDRFSSEANNQKMSLKKLGDQHELSEDIIKKLESLDLQKMFLLNREKRKLNKGSNVKYVVKGNKVKKICHKFTEKMKRTYIPIKYIENTEYQMDNNLENLQGLVFGQKMSLFLASLRILIELIKLIALSLIISYPTNLRDSNFSDITQSMSLVFLLIKIIFSFIVAQNREGKNLITLIEISKNYLSTDFMIDALTFFVTIFDIVVKNDFTLLTFFFISLIGSNIKSTLSKIEQRLISNFRLQNYWQIIKIMLFNLLFAHFLSMLLVMMAKLDESNNWMITKGINKRPLIQKYIWSYYWSTTIMLTIGFGDIVPSNHREAGCLIFIEIVSCIALAYNINYIGCIINKIRNAKQEKQKQIKMLNHLKSKNKLPQDLSNSIGTFITQSFNIKQQFNLEEQKKFIEHLPIDFKRQILRESNKFIFKNLPFFKNLFQVTLLELAQKLQGKICHTGQKLIAYEKSFGLMILRKGEIGLGCQNGRIIQTVKVNQKESPILLGLHFINKKYPSYLAKSLNYSSLYVLDEKELMKCLQTTKIDYEYYSMLRDKNHGDIDQFQIINCEECKTNHTKFDCPRLHFIPIHLLIIQRHLKKLDNCQNNRCIEYKWRKSNTFKPLLEKKKLKIGSSPLSLTNIISGYNEDIKVNWQYFVGKLKKIQQTRQLDPPLETKILNMINAQSSIFHNFTETLALAINSSIKSQLCQDELWIIQSDRMHNFRGYFPNYNPQILRQQLPKWKRTIYSFENDSVHISSFNTE